MDEQKISVVDAAQHYADGVRRGKDSERERFRRIVESELGLYVLKSENEGKQFTAEAKAVQKMLAGILGQI